LDVQTFEDFVTERLTDDASGLVDGGRFVGLADVLSGICGVGVAGQLGRRSGPPFEGGE